MRLFGRRPGASLRLEPEGAFRPTEDVVATVEVAEPIDDVTDARVEIGYRNGFRHHWAGRKDAALSRRQGGLLSLDQVDSGAGGDKDGEAWVHVLDAPLVVAGGVLGTGTQQVRLRLPSWSPGSSAEVVRWEARLHVARGRGGRGDAVAEAAFRVLTPAPDPLPASADLPLVQGERALARSILFDLETERGAYRAGDEVRGTVTVTPRELVERTALLAAWFQKLTESHPLEKNPTRGPADSYLRPMTTFATDVRLVQGQASSFPFALRLPEDVDPTTEAVHSSISWFVQVKVEFSGLTGGIERAQRGLVVYTG